MDQDKLNEIIQQHKHWINKDCEGWEAMRACLSYCDLSGANLQGVDLRQAILTSSNLSGATLRYSDLSGARMNYVSLKGADLYHSDCRDASLFGASLICSNIVLADFKGADIRYADFQEAIVMYTNLKNTNLAHAFNVPQIPMTCPDEGSFIGWKAVKNSFKIYIVKMSIPAEARRSSGTTRKCRAEFVDVLDIYDLDTGEKVDKVFNGNEATAAYVVGRRTYADRWDEDRFNECSHGIHFFINRIEAEGYYKQEI